MAARFHELVEKLLLVYDFSSFSDSFCSKYAVLNIVREHDEDRKNRMSKYTVRSKRLGNFDRYLK
jgi:hypothetical protein